jgi:hypothetical protein
MFLLLLYHTLREQGLHLFHVQRVQALQPGDSARRMACCQWILQKIDEAPNFLRQLLTDEADFISEGVFNNHNTHVWSHENLPQVMERRFQEQFFINVRAGIISCNTTSSQCYADYFCGVTLTTYESYLEDYLMNQIPQISFSFSNCKLQFVRK